MIERIKKFVNRIVLLILPVPEPVPEGEKCCTIKGMRRKVVFYGCMILAGIIGYFAIHEISIHVLNMDTITINLREGGEYSKFYQGGTYSLTAIEWIIFLVTFLSIAVTPVIRFIPWGTVFIDTLYCVSVGYNTAFMYWGVAQSNMHVALITLYLSLSLCLIPYLLFKFHIIKLPPFFSKIVYVLFWVLVMGGSIFRILCFIPGVNYVAVFFYDLYNLPGAGEVLLIFRIIIYFLFIFLSLDNLIKFVKRRASVKYEWTMTFHLIYTITILVNYCLLFVLAHVDELMKVFSRSIDYTKTLQ